MKKTGYTYEQHIALGQELKKIRDSLSDIKNKISRAYPNKLADKAAPALKAVEDLRNEMNIQLCKEHSDKSDLMLVYYPVNPNRLNKLE